MRDVEAAGAQALAIRAHSTRYRCSAVLFLHLAHPAKQSQCASGACSALFSTNDSKGGRQGHPSLQDSGNKLLLRQWNRERNLQELGLTPGGVTLGSKKPVHWDCDGCPSCSLQHSWQASIWHRVFRGMSCTLLGSRAMECMPEPS